MKIYKVCPDSSVSASVGAVGVGNSTLLKDGESGVSVKMGGEVGGEAGERGGEAECTPRSWPGEVGSEGVARAGSGGGDEGRAGRGGGDEGVSC